MLNFLNGNDQQDNKKVEEERIEEMERHPNRMEDSSIRIKKTEECENGYKNQYSVLQVRIPKYLYFYY